MAFALPVINAVAGVVSVTSTLKAQRDQKRADQAQQEQQRQATRRSRRSAIRSAQVQAAQARASAASFGADNSSGSLGGLSSLGSQLGTGLGFSTQMSGLSNDITRYAASARTNQALAGLTGQLFQATGGLSRFTSNFSNGNQGNPTAPLQAPARPTPRPTFTGLPNPYAIPNGIG